MKDMLSRFAPAGFETSAPTPAEALPPADLLKSDPSLKNILEEIKDLGIDPSFLTMKGSRQDLRFSFVYEEEALRMDSSGCLDYRARSLSLDLSISSISGNIKANGADTGVQKFRLELELTTEEITMRKGSEAPADAAQPAEENAERQPVGLRMPSFKSLQEIIDRFFGRTSDTRADDRKAGDAEGGAQDGMFSNIEEMAEAAKELSAKVLDILKKLTDVMDQLKKKSSDETGLYDKNGASGGAKQTSRRIESLMISFKLEMTSVEIFRAEPAKSKDETEKIETSPKSEKIVESGDAGASSKDKGSKISALESSI
jgi:hypothetical protein